MKLKSIVIILLLITTACSYASVDNPTREFEVSPRVSALTISLFEDASCMSSCWQGLRPAVSTLDEVQDYFEKHVQADTSQFQVTEASFFVVGVHEDGHSILANIHNGLLFDFALYGPFNTPLSELIAHLNGVGYLELAVRPDSEVRDTYNVIFRLYYHEDGFVFSVDIDNDSELRINDEGSVARICLNDNSLLSNIIVTEAGSINFVLQNLQRTHMPYATTALIDTLIEVDSSSLISECFETAIR